MLKRALERLSLLESAHQLVGTASLARHRFAWARRRGFGRSDRRLVADYLCEHSPRKLHLGAGNHLLPGWLNSDLHPPAAEVLHLDATRTFPFEDVTFDYVFSEHMIEHLTYADGVRMLRECHRVLKPGGRVRVSTPDLRTLVRLYQGESGPVPDAFLAWHHEWIVRDGDEAAPAAEPVFVLNNFVRDWGHQFIYDEPALRRALTSAGFDGVVTRDLNASDDPALADLENAARAPEGVLAFETLTLEASRR